MYIHSMYTMDSELWIHIFKIFGNFKNSYIGPVYISRSPGGRISFPVAQSAILICTISGSLTGTETFSWSSSCSPNCDGDLTGTDQSELSVTNLRARDTGSYTCTVTDGGVMVRVSTATISRVEGTYISHAYYYCAYICNFIHKLYIPLKTINCISCINESEFAVRLNYRK